MKASSMQLVWISTSFWTRISLVNSHKGVHKAYASYLLRIFSLAQTLILTCENIELSKTSEKFALQQPFEYLKNLIGFKIAAANLFETSSSIVALMTILVFYFLFLIIMTFHASNSYDSRTKKIVSFLTTLHSEALFYPICLLLANMIESIFQNKHVFMSAEIGFPILGTLYLLNASITLFKIAFCYSLIVSKKLISRKGCLHLLGLTVLKLFLPILHLPSLKNAMESKALAEVTSVSLSVIISFYIWRYSLVKLPEYDLRLMKGHIVFNSIMVLATLSQMIIIMTRGNESLLNITFFIFPFWIKLNLIFFEKILKRLLIHTKNIRNVNYLVHLEKLCQNFEDSLILNYTKRTFSKQALDTYWIYPVDFESSDCSCSSSDLVVRQRTVVVKFLKTHYEGLQQRKALNVLGSLSYAHLVLKYFGMAPKAYSLCLQILNRKSSIPDKISAFHIIYKVEKTFGKEIVTGSSENKHSKLIWESFLVEGTFNDFQSSIWKYTQAAINYWEIFKSEQPDISKLINKARLLDNQILALETQWRNHEPKFAKNFSMAYLLYGSLQVQFLNKPWEGTDKIKKYDHVTFCQNMMKERLNTNPKDSAVVTISTEKKDMGNVLNVTENFSKLFGIEKKSIIGQNINQIMPKFFAERHNQFLLDYYETGKSSLIGRETRQIGKDNNDNIFPIYINLVLNMTQNQGVVVSALIQKVYDQKEYILLSEDGFIQEFSRKIGMLLNIEPYKKVHIQSVCPKYDLNNQDTYSTTFVGRMNSCEVSIKCQVKMESYSYANSYLHIIIMNFEEDIWNNYYTLGKQNRPPKEVEEIQSPSDVRNQCLSQNPHISGSLLEVNKGTNLADTKCSNTDASLIMRKVLIFPQKVSNNSSINIPPERLSFSDKKKNKKVLLESNSKTADEIQDMYKKSYSKTSAILFTGIFILLLLLNFGVEAVQYFTFRASVKDIKFAAEVVTDSYNRLNALSWIYRYAIRYQAIVSNIAAVTNAELDRYKVIISSNRELVRAANNDLIDSIVNGAEEDQRSFFRENIEMDYSNDIRYVEGRKTDTFQIIDVFIEKLLSFDTTPHNVLLKNGNPDLEFVRRNIPDSLLISSEEMIEITKGKLVDKIYAKTKLLMVIFGLSLLTTFLTMSITIITSYADLKNIERLMKTLLTIKPIDIDLIISKLKSFNKIMFNKENLVTRSLYLTNVKQDMQNAKPDLHSLFLLSLRKYRIKGVMSLKIKQCSFVIILLFPFLIINILEFHLTSGLLQDLLTTNDRFIIGSKARYYINMASATVFDLIVFYNTTTIRNEPTATQLMKNLDNIVSNELIFKAFTDETGQFIDPSLEILFRGKPCSLVVDYPGSNNPTNCPRATNDETIGIFALNSQYYQEISAIGRDMLGNLVTENAKIMYPKMVNNLGHKTSTLVGAYIYICDLMKNSFDQQVDGASSHGPIRLVLEISFMSMIGILSVWFFVKRILDDSHVRIVLKTVPYSEMVKNALLKKFIKDLYKNSPELISFDHHLNG